MTRHTVLEYLGLRRVPGSRTTPADHVWTVVMVIAVVTTLFLTRNLAVWPQVSVVVVVSVIVGILRGTTHLTAAAGRSRLDAGA